MAEAWELAEAQLERARWIYTELGRTPSLTRTLKG